MGEGMSPGFEQAGCQTRRTRGRGRSAALAPLPEAPPLPRPLANNAVAAVRDDAGWSVYTALGLDTTTLQALTSAKPEAAAPDSPPAEEASNESADAGDGAGDDAGDDES